jgi:hypothetical protein
MTDPINSFIANNIYLIIFILFLFITYWLRNEVGKLVDRFLTMKNLKATLFIVLLMMVFLISNTFYNFIHIDVSLVAPYMIAMSALLASLVAIINMRKSYIERVIDKADDIIAITHNAIIRISFLYEKSSFYKKIFMGEVFISVEILNEFEMLLRDIVSLLNSKEVHRHISGQESKVLYELHGNIFLLLALQKRASILLAEKVFDDNQLKMFDDTMEDLKKLEELFISIRENSLLEHDKLVIEEQ